MAATNRRRNRQPPIPFRKSHPFYVYLGDHVLQGVKGVHFDAIEYLDKDGDPSASYVAGLKPFGPVEFSGTFGAELEPVKPMMTIKFRRMRRAHLPRWAKKALRKWLTDRPLGRRESRRDFYRLNEISHSATVKAEDIISVQRHS